MTVYITGDTHGCVDIDKIFKWELAPTLTRSDYLIVAGDFGYPWDLLDPMETDEILELEKGPYTLLFIDGNHENYEYWASRPTEMWHGGRVQRLRAHSPIRRLCRGEVFDIDGQTFFTMGGANSVDKAFRTENFDWWPQEMPSERNYENARVNLEKAGWNVDYVITHTCSNRMLPYALWPNLGWQTPDFDELTGFLDSLEDSLTFKHWYFGHMHRDRNCDDTHTLLYNQIIEIGQGVLEE